MKVQVQGAVYRNRDSDIWMCARGNNPTEACNLPEMAGARMQRKL